MTTTKHILTIGLLLFIAVKNTAQIPDISYTNATNAANYLVGEGVTVSNASFTGHNKELGLFSDGLDKIGFPQGVVIATGDAKFAGTYQNSNPGDAQPTGSTIGDIDLEMINGIGVVHNAAFLEFDFVTTGTSIEFEIVFASEEYPDYVGSDYNDAFGLWYDLTCWECDL